MLIALTIIPLKKMLPIKLKGKYKYLDGCNLLPILTWIGLAPFDTIFKVQNPKFQKSMFLVPSATSVIGMNYLYVDRAQKSVFSKMLRFRHQGYQIKALLKVDEEFQISDISKNHLRAENGMRNVSKFKFLAWISPFFHLKSKEFGFLPLS